eukprot:Clim_evm23s39 gene=Clim_evmTU23s39
MPSVAPVSDAVNSASQKTRAKANGEIVLENGISAMSTSDEVAYAFVQQYYMRLHSSPADLPRFYNASAQVSRGFVFGQVLKANGETEVSQLISDLKLEKAKVKIISIDTQHTGSNIVVLVTGWMWTADKLAGDFAQTFVLEPMTGDKGARYACVNDILRFWPRKDAPKIAPAAPVKVEKAEAKVAMSTEAEAPKAEALAAEIAKVEEKPKVAAPKAAPAAPAAPAKASEPEAPKQPAGPRSWANLVSSGKPAAPASAPTSAPAKPKPAPATSTAPAAADEDKKDAAVKKDAGATPATVIGNTDVKYPSELSAYLPQIPNGTDPTELNQKLLQFGKVGKLDVRERGHGFVFFEEASGLEAAIGAGGVQCASGFVKVEARKPRDGPPSSRSGQRGRGGAGRGGARK